MNKCIVFYENWQKQCCGKDFSNSNKIKWLVCDGSEIKLSIKVDNIDYCYEAHSSNYKNLFVLEGTIDWIKAFYEKYEITKDIPRMKIGVDGILCDIESSCDITDNKDDMEFSGYNCMC